MKKDINLPEELGLQNIDSRLSVKKSKKMVTITALDIPGTKIDIWAKDNKNLFIEGFIENKPSVPVDQSYHSDTFHIKRLLNEWLKAVIPLFPSYAITLTKEGKSPTELWGEVATYAKEHEIELTEGKAFMLESLPAIRAKFNHRFAQLIASTINEELGIEAKVVSMTQ